MELNNTSFNEPVRIPSFDLIPDEDTYSDPILFNCVPKSTLPTNSVQEIVQNLPEIQDVFDVPDYVEFKGNSNGAETSDHDYMRPMDSDIDLSLVKDHDYVIKSGPPCLTIDFRYFCNICSSNSHDVYAFNRHMRMHMERNDIACPLCSQTFLTTNCLNTHMTSHMSICTTCDTWVPTIQIKFHILANRKQRRVIEKFHAKNRVHFCVVCMRGFSHEKIYLKHLKTAQHLFNARH